MWGAPEAGFPASNVARPRSTPTSWSVSHARWSSEHPIWPADDCARVVEALGGLVRELPRRQIDIRLMLDFRMRPEGLRDALLAMFPTIRRTVGDDLEPALRELADAACPRIVEFFTRRENYSAAAITHLVAQGGDRFPEERHLTFDRAAGIDLAPLAANPRLEVGISDPTEFWSV